MTKDTLGWGILGTGAIARKFASDLRQVPGAVLAAIGSRRAEDAAAFAREFGAAEAHDGYEALVASAAVDVVYVATPNCCHRPNTLLALAAGKPVLCEKPFALTAAEALDMIQAARTARLFLMEAMWTRFFPAMNRLRTLITQGELGAPRILQADFGFHANAGEQQRVFDPALGGGALLDVGIYPISLAWHLLGPPQRIHSTAHLGPTGVDESSAIILQYDDGRLALLSASITADTAQELVLSGTRATARLPRPWWKPAALVLSREESVEQRIDLPYGGLGYQFEILEVMRCLRAGELESPGMPLDETYALMQALDTIRAQWRPGGR
jgi:predicted dehydrogenase